MRRTVFMQTVAVLAAVIVLAAIMSLGACSTSVKADDNQNTQAQETSAATTAAATEKPAKESAELIEVTDGIGNELILNEPVKKVIVFVPSALEIIDGLGAMDRVIGVDSWSVDSKEPLAEGFEGFGDFNSLNMEKIAAASPDMIIGLIGWAEEDIQKLFDLGIKVYIVDANTVDEIYTEITNMGRILGLNEEAAEMGLELKKQIDEIASKVEGLKQDDKPKVFYEVYNDPLMSAGKNTFINELIEISGGINIVAQDGLEGWPEYSLEKLVQNNPDIMIAPTSLAPDAEAILSEARFSKIAAITNKKVYIVPDNPVSRPSQNIIKGLKMIAQAIHPDIFGEFTVLQ